jgi:rSAM/selenodomain-associated transferase 2
MAEPSAFAMKLSVIIPTLEAGDCLSATLGALGGADEVLIVDGGSRDRTCAIAGAAGARVISATPGRGHQLMTGGELAQGPWLLFLHADTVLDPGWREEVARFIAGPQHAQMAAVFRFALDDPFPAARRLERWVECRVRRLGLAYGDQGLLIHRDFYRSVGGYRPLPLMEDVDLVRRIGRRRLVLLDAKATTSPRRWQRDGWLWRSVINLGCLSLYFLGVSPRALKRLYG